MPSNKPYVAPFWLPGSHAQTIYPLLIKTALPPYRRERWDTPDGDFIDVDWIDSSGQSELIVLFHGLEGSSASHYATSLMSSVKNAGRSGVVIHFRGCSGELNRLPRAYHSGDSSEIDWVLQRLRKQFPERKICVVGVSLGGNALLKWLGEQGAKAIEVINLAASVCAPLDLAICGHHLDVGVNKVYTRHFLRTLKRKAAMKLSRFPGIFEGRRMLAANNLYQFDDAVTARLHGFRDAGDYWQRSSAKPFLRSIEVPTLLLNARNDPFLPAYALPGPDEVSQSVHREFLSQGGHVGFVGGRLPGHLDWLPDRLLRFFGIDPEKTEKHEETEA